MSACSANNTVNPVPWVHRDTAENLRFFFAFRFDWLLRADAQAYISQALLAQTRSDPQLQLRYPRGGQLGCQWRFIYERGNVGLVSHRNLSHTVRRVAQVKSRAFRGQNRLAGSHVWSILLPIVTDSIIWRCGEKVSCGSLPKSVSGYHWRRIVEQ